MTYTLGADPEVFLRDKITKTVMPACGMFGGTKRRPKAIPSLGMNYAYQEDNVMLEFNIPPSGHPDSAVESIRKVRQYMAGIIAEQYPNLEIAPRCVYTFPYTKLSHSKAKQFGCAPDFNAYEAGEAYPRMNEELLTRPGGELRFAGGHLHLGYKADVPPHVAAQFCDALIGLPAVVKDKQERRRAHYGQAGRYRPTAYGVEYRTLSNYWFFDDGECYNAFLRLSEVGAMFNYWSVENIQALYTEIPWGNVRQAINNEDSSLAEMLISYITELKNR